MPSTSSRYSVDCLAPYLVHEILARIASTHGLTIVRSDHLDDERRTEFVQTRPWYAVLIHQPTQRLSCILKPSGIGTLLDMNRRFFNWYRTLVFCIGAFAGGLFMYGMVLLFSLDAFFTSTRFYVLLMVLFTSFMLLHVVATLIRTQACTLLDDLREEIVRRRALLEEDNVGMWAADYRGPIVMLTYLVLLLIAGVWFSGIRPSHLDPRILIGIGAGIGLFLSQLGLLAVAIRRTAAGLRLGIASSSLGNAIVIATLMMGLCIAMLFGIPRKTAWDRMLAESGGVTYPYRSAYAGYRSATASDLSSPVNIVEGRQVMSTLFAVICIFFVVGGMYTAFALRNVRPIMRLANRLQSQIEGGMTHSAVSGKGFFGLTRLLMIMTWIGFGIITVVPSACVLLTGLAGCDLCRLFLGPHRVGVVEGTAMASALALGLPGAGPNLLLLSRVFWAASAICILLLWVMSFMSFCGPRQTALRMLRASVASGPAAQKWTPIRELLAGVAQRAGCPPPQLVITPRSDPYAAAHEFGFLKPERYLEVSARFLEILEPAEVEALLAHELAHFICGHCRGHNLLHLLARFTFVGGGFISGIENSFKYELEADRLAVARLNVRLQVLRSCLEKTLVTLALDSVRGRRLPIGLAFAHNHGASGRLAGWVWGKRPDTHPRFHRVRLWLSVYASDVDVFSYWHPSLRERIASIKAMEGSQ